MASTSHKLPLAIAALLILSSTTSARLVHRVNHLSVNRAVAVMKQTIDELNAGIAAAEKLKAGVRNDQKRANYLDGCKTHYSDAVGNLEGAIERINAGYAVSSPDVEVDVQSATFDVELCSTEWAESKIPDFPLKEVDGKLQKLVTDTFHFVEGGEN